MRDFNLIVTSSRFREEEACEEMLDLLDSFGDPSAEAEMNCGVWSNAITI